EDPRWAGLEAVPDNELWEAHVCLRRRLVVHARDHVGADGLDPDALTIGFSRRFALYKRANLLLHDRVRLAGILGSQRQPVQFVFAGKAHPADQGGKGILREIVQLARHESKVAFIEDYDIE